MPTFKLIGWLLFAAAGSLAISGAAVAQGGNIEQATLAEVPHTHPGEYIAYVLEGAFEFEVAGRPKAIYRVGDSFFVEGGRVHSGRNVADGPTKLLITFILEKGQPPSSPAK